MVNGLAYAGATLSGLVILVVLLWLLIIGIAIFAFIFWILMLVDAVKRNFKSDTDKIVWVLVIIFTHIIGALIYYFMVKRKKK